MSNSVSGLSRWCLWNGLYVPYSLRDVTTPGEPHGEWSRNGYTGTLYKAGKVVRDWDNLLPGDLILYGGFPGHHVAVYVGGGFVISHGSEGGPYKLPVHYRGDASQARRYI
jgi:hypothetical protein